MQNNQKYTLDIGGILAITGLFITLFGAPLSRAMVSIGTAVFAAALIAWSIRSQWNLSVASKRMLLIVGILVIVSFIDHLRSPVEGKLLYQFILIVPLILVAPVIMNLRIDHRMVRGVILLVMLLFTIMAIWSSVNYFLNRDEIDAMLLQSKHVPLVTHMHHIYFGLFLAALSWVGIHYGVRSRSTMRYFFFGMSAAMIISMHVLSSRTGLLGFYASAGIYLLMILGRSTSPRLKLRLITAAILLPLLSALLIPSVRMKIENTREDIASLAEGGEELNFKSFAMRTESWKAGWSAIKQNWLLGVGSGAYESAVAKGYEEIHTPLFVQNRISPHNQFLDSWLRYGVLGLLLSISLFVIPFVRKIRHRSDVFWPLWGLTVSAFMVETVLQRQLGIIWFAIFYFLFFVEKPERKSPAQN